MPRLVYKVKHLQKRMFEKCCANATELGQISASFNALQRSIDEYDNLAKRELIPVKKEIALT
jgi:hypothetical protein